MVMETCDKVVRNLGTADIDARLEELLIDGILYAYQEQVGAWGEGGTGGRAAVCRASCFAVVDVPWWCVPSACCGLCDAQRRRAAQRQELRRSSLCSWRMSRPLCSTALAP